MFDIQRKSDGVIALIGRLDAAQVPKAEAVLGQLSGDITVDFAALDYISSSGLGQLFALYRRVTASGNRLKLVGMTPQVKYVFHLGRLDTVFDIE